MKEMTADGLDGGAGSRRALQEGGVIGVLEM
jgi:hypothetical protein